MDPSTACLSIFDETQTQNLHDLLDVVKMEKGALPGPMRLMSLCCTKTYYANIIPEPQWTQPASAKTEHGIWMTDGCSYRLFVDVGPGKTRRWWSASTLHCNTFNPLVRITSWVEETTKCRFQEPARALGTCSRQGLGPCRPRGMEIEPYLSGILLCW